MRFFDTVVFMRFSQYRPNEPVASDIHSREPTTSGSAVFLAYSPPINSPFSATERFIRSTRSTSARLRTANSQKTSK